MRARRTDWNERRLELAAVVLLTLVAAGIRFSTIGLQSFWFDEALTAAVVQPGLGDTIDALVEREANPPVYFVVAWLWTRLFGEGDIALRSLSAVAGTLTVPFAYLAARQLASKRAGFIAAALAAASPLLVWYSQEARSYALAVLFSAISFYFFTRAAAGGRDGRDLALWSGFSVLAVGTHYFAAFPVVFEAALILRAWGMRQATLAAMAPIAVVGALLIPLAVHQQSDGQVDWIADLPLRGRLIETAKTFISGVTTGSPGQGLGLVAAVLSMVGAVLLVTRARGQERSGGLTAGAIALAGLAAALVCSALGVDFLYYRNLMVLWVPLAVAVAAGIAALRPRRAAALGALLTALLLTITIRVMADDAYHRTDWESAVASLGESASQRAIVVSPGFAQLALIHYDLNIHYNGGRPVRVRELTILSEFGSLPAGPGDDLFGFTVTEQDRMQDVQVTRLRSPVPREVIPGDVDGASIGSRDARLVVEEPAAKAR